MLKADWERPSFEIIRAAHVEYVVTDLHRAHEFYVDLLGFVVSNETPEAIYLRGYEESSHHSIVLKRGPRPMVGHMSFRVASERDLDELARYFEKHSSEVHWVREEELCQGPAMRVQDPLGFPAEFFCEMAREDRLLQRHDLHRGAQIMRLDHFNLHVPDVQRSYDYYKSLGFRCSEYTSTDPPDEQLWGAWMYRKPNVHDVALMNGKGPRFHHTGFWVTDTSSVLRTCDVLAASGHADAIERGPGRHGLSNAFFLYLRDPDGHRIELYTNDYFTGDPDFEPIRWSVTDPRRGTFWGHAAPATWFEESSPVARYRGGTMDVQEELLAERPPTAT